MKYKKIKVYILGFILISTIFLTACKNNSKVSSKNPLEKVEKSNLLGEINKDNAGKLEEGLKNEWTDINKLIRIWKEEDAYYIYYDLDKWEEIHNIKDHIKDEYPNSTLADRILLIDGLEEDIKDVSIVSIDGYGGSNFEKNKFPLIFMLMESGKVTWMHGYPPMDSVIYEGEEFKQEEQYIYGYLPFLKDVVSFTYESEKEGVGDLTLFAMDKEGLRYDIRHILDFNDLAFGLWSIFPTQDYGGEFEKIIISLLEDKEAKIYKIKDNREVEIYYEGEYELHLDDSSSKGYRAPSLSLDLKLVDKKPGNYKVDSKFNGTFMLDLENNYNIVFYHMDGDSFEKGVDNFTFIRDTYEGRYDDFNIWYFNDKEFIDYFLNVMPEVGNKVIENTMSLLVEDATELVDYGYCRDISLGTNHDGHFVRQIHYTVTESGIVFEYDPFDDLWYIKFEPEES